MNLRESFAETLEKLEWLEADQVDEPYRGLLCHESDMTSTLARFHQGEVKLEVRRKEVDGDSYLREVVLCVNGNEVEHGLIEIHLDHLPEGLRKRVLEEREPFGGILNESETTYRSEPVGFFRTADGNFLFGRYNTLLDEGGRVLARIIEILPRMAS